MTASLRDDVTELPLFQRYRGLVCDLDGVVYRGPDAIPGAVDALNLALTSGIRITFATNNASRPPQAVAAHVRELGVAGTDWSVVTSAQAGAAYLARTVPPASLVLAVGGPGVHEALYEVGLVPVRVAGLHDTMPPVAVLQGLGTDVTWTELAEVAHRTEAGLPWVATNLDQMLPTARGAAPGNGALVAAVRTATSAAPHVVGKPAPDLYDLCCDRLAAAPADILACGDRLDTDIAGAHAAGLDSLLVLTGAASLCDAAIAAPHERPTYVSTGLDGMLDPLLPIAASRVPGVAIGPDGLPSLADETGPFLLGAVLAACWAEIEAGGRVETDARAWLPVERALGVRDG
jgi:HAD superfamily hydrolase (TIGR01450 family)